MSIRNQASMGTLVLAFLSAAAVLGQPAPPATTRAFLAQTPPMGWNSWNAFRLDITDKIILAQAKAMVKSGMKDAGYEYVVIDGGWEGHHDAQGLFHSDPDRFPDMKKLCDDIHALGLKVGIHTSPGPRTCAGHEASFGHEEQDAQTFADWGIDFVKYDWCSADQVYKPEQMQAAYKKFYDAIQATHRPMLYSLCQYGMQNVWRWGEGVGGQMWRTTGDLQDNYFQMIAVASAQLGLERYAGPGHWNDPDMLEVGNKGLKSEESRTQMTLWCILAAPLFAGNDLTKMTDETRDTLTNKEAIAINQDKLGIQGHRIWQEGPLQIWAKSLADHSTALALFSIGSKEMEVSVDLKDLNFPSTIHARDLWQHKDLEVITKTLHIQLPHHGSAMLRVEATK